MEYTATKWQNGGPPAINASNLNNIEDGIATAAKELNTKTSVTVSGSNVATFDADSKVDKVNATEAVIKAGDEDSGTGTLTVGKRGLTYTCPNGTLTVSGPDGITGFVFRPVDDSTYQSHIGNNSSYLDIGSDLTISSEGAKLKLDYQDGDGCVIDADKFQVGYSTTLNQFYIGDFITKYESKNNDQLTITDNNNAISFADSQISLGGYSGEQVTTLAPHINVSSNEILLSAGDNYNSYIKIQPEYSNTVTVLGEIIEIDTAAETGGEIKIQGAPTSTIRVHNQKYGLVIDSSNSLSIGTVDSSGGADKAYLQINSDGANVPTPKEDTHIANKKYVDDATYSYIQNNESSTEVPIDIDDADITIIRAYSDEGIIFGPESDNRWVELTIVKTIVKSDSTQSTTYYGCGIKRVSSNGSLSNNFTPYCTSSTNAPQLCSSSEVFITKNKVHSPSSTNTDKSSNSETKQ